MRNNDLPDPDRRRPATMRVARWSATHPWRAIGFWLVFVAACVAIGQAAGLKTVTELDTSVGESGHAARMLHDTNLAHDAVFSSLATGSILVVAVAVLGSLTVLPAVLAKLGRRLDRPRVPVLWRLFTQTREPRLWPALLRPALARPGRTLVLSVLGLGALAVPALSMTLHSDSAASLPRTIAATHTLDRLSAAFPGEQTTHEVVVQAPSQDAGTVQARLTTLAQSLDGNPLFARSTSGRPVVRSSSDGRVHQLKLDAPFDSESAQAKSGVQQLRRHLVADSVGSIPGATWAVGGDTAENVDYDHHLGDRMPWVVGFVVVLTMVMMAWIFRSIVLALVTAFVNLLSAGAAFGVLALTFQHTWAEKLLDFRSTGGVISWIPLFTFAVLFGLSMDCHVFVISRIRELAAAGVPTRDAVRIGITRSAGTVTSAAIIMVSVFAIFASLHMIEMKELGIGLAVAVLIDALVVRGVVLPALMSLLGRANWWPSTLSSRERWTALASTAPHQPELVG